MCVQWNPSNADTSGTHLKCPDYRGVLYSGVGTINVTCLGPRGSVLFVEVYVFQGVRISRFHCICIIVFCVHVHNIYFYVWWFSGLTLFMHTHTQVPRNVDEYIGEILLGLKYRPQKSCDREGDLPQSDVEEDSGQLHVHIVEGAGICSEDTHQPFNAFVKW